MTKYVRVPARILHRVPDGLPFEKAALTEPCCVAYNAVVNNAQHQARRSRRRLRPGADRHAVRRDGAAVRRGGRRRRAGARPRSARDRRKQYGCTSIVGDAKEWAKAVDGLGADGVVDAAGVSATLEAAMDIVRPGGWISKVGWGPQPLGFSLDPLVQKNITLQGSFSHNWPIWERVIRLLSTGQLDVQADHRRRLAAGAVARGVRDDALREDRESGAEAVSGMVASATFISNITHSQPCDCRQVIMVTGSTTGIGEAMARRFVAEGGTGHVPRPRTRARRGSSRSWAANGRTARRRPGRSGRRAAHWCTRRSKRSAGSTRS